MLKFYFKRQYFCFISLLLVLTISQNREGYSNELTFGSSFAVELMDVEITGRVTDESGATLPGVTVVVKDNPSIGTTTDLNGRYVLEVPDNAVLVFRMIGFDEQEISINGEARLNVQLLPSTSILDETVIVGFGTQKREDMVGAVTTVKPSELRVPSSNLTTALAGRIAGMISFQRSGEPGEDNADFFIRGVTTFGTGKKEPLILIDGIELDVTALSRLRSDDIESFSVLKDATATAVYGSRAANGVILVKTKEGMEGRPNVSFRAESSLSMPTKNVEFADPVEYMELYNEALLARDPFAEPRYAKQKIDGTKDDRFPILFPAVNWKSMLFKKKTFNHRYNLNVRGGGKVARYYVAGSFSQDNGDLRVPKENNFNNNIDLKSYTLRANVNISLTKHTELIVRLNGNFDDYNGPLKGGSSVYNDVVHANPVDFVPFYPKDSTNDFIEHVMFGGISERPFNNPYAELVRGYKDYSRSLMMAQMELNQDFSFLTEGLKFNAIFNTHKTSQFGFSRSYKPFFYELGISDNRTGDYSLTNFNETEGTEFLDFAKTDGSQITDFYLQASLNYDKTFKEIHSVSGMLVSLVQSSLDNAANSLQLTLPHRNVGLSGRFTYSFDKRYYTEFNFGYNGSERFDRSHRYGFFPSFGVAWTISNENFWEPLKETMNTLRLRVTYGLIGNDEIGSKSDRFFYMSEVNMNSSERKSTFGELINHSRNGVKVNRYANPLISWEKSKKVNIGLEMGLMNNLDIKVDMYHEKRYSILMNRSFIPASMGLAASIKSNVGVAIGEGLDISIDYDKVLPNQMWLQVHSNFTYAHSEYKIYDEPYYENEWWKSRVGEPLSQPHGYIAEHLFTDDKEVANSPSQDFGVPIIGGDIKYKDINGDGRISSLDIVPIGYPTIPEIIYGGGFSFGWKSLDFSVFVQGAARTSFFIDPSAVQPFVNGKQILDAFSKDHYSINNPNIYSLWPRLSTEDQINNVQKSTWWLRDGLFLRIKQIEFGYSLPESIIKRVRIKNIRVYLSASNLYNFSKFKLWDTEMGGNGLGYPLQKVFNFGINVSF